MTTSILIIFVVGYLAIILEHNIKLNKAASALATGVLCWTVYITNQPDPHHVSHQLMAHLGEISGILFFLLGAMTVVELVDAHDGFQIITDKIRTKSAKKLIWVICGLTFFLSAILDNLTTTIVMVSLLRKLIEDREQRLFFVGMTIIAANAGGAWSPLGDVTTTMLWIGGQVTTLNVVTQLFMPSLVCLLIPLLFVSTRLKGNLQSPPKIEQSLNSSTAFERNLVFFLGLGVLVFVPVFKTLTHLPPFMGMLLGLSFLWAATEMIHSGKDNDDKSFLSVVYALRKVDAPSILFFLGILLGVSVLQSTGQLAQLAQWLTDTVANETVIVLAIGLLSSIVDNVPLVAASQAMYSLEQYPTDHYFWEFLAYAAGTGGSALIIGSAAGVAAMGMEKIDFFWYLKRISWLALVGYFAGAAVYWLQYNFVH